jgi:type III secretory pathway component EscV
MSVAIQPRIIETRKHISIAYLLLQVIHFLYLHLSTVFLFDLLITERTLSHQKSLLLLMLQLLQNYFLR